LAAASLCTAADALSSEAKTLRARYALEIKKLAEWCEDQGLTAEAKKTRDALGRQDPFKLYLPILPQEIGPAKPPADASAEAIDWTRRFQRLRQEQAAALYDLAWRAVRKRQLSLAYQLAVQSIRENPDHEGARRVFGYQRFNGQWRTAYEVKKLQKGMVWHPKFGWIAKANVARYEQGERLSGGRWISAEEDARLHRGIAAGWELETEHYRIRTNSSIEQGVELAANLENLNRLWQQVFVRFYASETYVESLFSGKGQARRTDPPRFDVMYYRTKDEYNRALASVMPNVDITTGMYVASRRTAFFFAGGEDTQRVIFHEATHQLFHQSRPVANDVGAKANFWLVEGIAMFMESLHREDGFFVLGGLEGPRMEAARYHLFVQDFYVPFATLTHMGMEDLQTHPKIAKLYSQMAAMTHFLVFHDDGQYRDALVSYLSAVYKGDQDPATLARLTGADYAELDRQYQQFMKIGVAPARSSSTPSE
jgi:hypothetical protein